MPGTTDQPAPSWIPGFILLSLGLACASLGAWALQAEDLDQVSRVILSFSSLAAPIAVAALWAFRRLPRIRDDRVHDQLFVVGLMVLWLCSVLAVMLLFAFEPFLAGLLALALFSMLAYLTRWL